MLFGTRYKFVGQRSDEETSALLKAFAEYGPAPGTIAHYVMADGRGGLVIHESESILDAYENLSNYTHWLEFESHPMVTIDEAIPVLMKTVG